MNKVKNILNVDQVYGENDQDKQLSIIKKMGKDCLMSDFAILLGGRVNKYCNFTSDSLKRKNFGSWLVVDDASDAVKLYSIGSDLAKSLCNVNDYTVGIRPVIDYSLIEPFVVNEFVDENGILEVEYGTYPYMVYPWRQAKDFERAYLHNAVKESGLVYTTDSIDYGVYSSDFQPFKHPEYIMRSGFSYFRGIRFAYDVERFDNAILSNDERIVTGNSYWLKTAPVRWLVDEQANLAIAKDIIVSGIKFASFKEKSSDNKEDNKLNKINFDFCLERFVNEYLLKDIINSAIWLKDVKGRSRSRF